MTQHNFNNIHLYCGDAMEFYNDWETPTVIVCDGPYGVNGFKGDLLSHKGLDVWYEPHIKKWSEAATPLTTLWFWNTEVGWATVHPILEKYGWTYVSCCVWDKGMSHVAGNTNTKTIRHLPVVTEVCVQYVKNPTFDVTQYMVGEAPTNWAKALPLETTPSGEDKGQTVPLSPHPKETTFVVSFVGLVRPHLVNTA